jgi:hypothetical protein
MKRFAVTALSVPVILFLFSVCCRSTPAPNPVDSNRFADRETIVAKITGMVHPFIDGNYIYFEGDAEYSSSCPAPAVVIRVDMRNGTIDTVYFCKAETSELFGVCGGFFYFYNWLNGTVYRYPITGKGGFEKVTQLPGEILDAKVGGSDILATITGSSRLYKFNLTATTAEPLSSGNVTWFDFNEKYIYWHIWHPAYEAPCSLTQMSRSTGRIVKVLADTSSPLVLSGDFLYYLTDSAKALMRLPVIETGPAQKVATLHGWPSGAYAVVNDVLYTTTTEGELWKISPDGALLLEQRGSYDDDDYFPWIGSDGSALFWFAGPQKGVRIEDEDEGVLIRTIIENK